jgi:hypothetical protein
MAAIKIQLDQINNDKSLVFVYIEGRPKIGEAHAVLVNTTDEKGRPAKRRDIKSQSFLRKIMDDYIEIDASTKMKVVLEQLHKVFGEEYDALLQVEQLTQIIVQNVLAEKYVVNNYKYFSS